MSRPPLPPTEASGCEAREPGPPAPLPARIRRASLSAAGLAFTGLAVVGVFLPLVPTTPFLLVALACFARSSPRLHRWLLSNRAVGPYLEEWRLHRTVPRAAKRKAYLVVVLGFGTSILLVQEPWLRVALLVLGAGVTVLVAWLPTSREEERQDPPPGGS